METNEVLNGRRFISCNDFEQRSENRNNEMETVKSCSSIDFNNKRCGEFSFSSKLVKVTEEDKRNKPKRTRNWKGRKAAERAKRQACEQTEVDAENPRLYFSGCLDSSRTNFEESSCDFLPSLDCLPVIEDYLTPVSFGNSFEELPSMESLEAETTSDESQKARCLREEPEARQRRSRANACKTAGEQQPEEEQKRRKIF